MNNLSLFAEFGDDTGLAGGIFLVCFAILLVGIVVWAIVFWIKMLIHALKTDIQDKALWILIIIVGQLVGAIAYYFVMVREQPKKSIKKSAKK